MEKFRPYLLGTLLYASILAGSAFFWHNKFWPVQTWPDQVAVTSEEQYITLLFAGDIMLDRGVEWQMTQHKDPRSAEAYSEGDPRSAVAPGEGDWLWPFRNIAKDIQKADIAFANLESQISDQGENVGSIYSFRADPKTLNGLVFAGFDILSAANNHSLDYGMPALRDSISRLRTAGIIPVGAGENATEAYAPAVIETKGARVAFLAYTSQGSPAWKAGAQNPGIAWADASNLSEIAERIRAIKETADIVAVSIHAGTEYQKEPDSFQKMFSEAAADAGADIIVNHHSHVAQSVERYKKSWIAYGLGNFVFDQGFSKETMEGTLLKVLIDKKTKSVTRVTPLVVIISPEFQPAISTESM